MIRFSVIIPCYNRVESIKETLSSLIEQTYKNFEVIVVDDCSECDIKSELSSLIKKFISKKISIRIIRNSKNSGPSFSRNIGWNLAKGEYIAFLDSDDIWASNKLELCNAFLSCYNIDVLGHPITIDKLKEIKKTNKWLIKPLGLKRLLMKNLMQTSCTILKRDITERFDVNMRYCEDYDLWLRLAQKKLKIIYLPELVLTKFSRKPLSSGGLSGNRWKMRQGELISKLRILKNYGFGGYLFYPFLIIFVSLKHFRNILKYSVLPRIKK